MRSCEAGIGSGEVVGEVRAGRRKGSEPVGEAWFVEGRVRKSRLDRRRRVCGRCVSGGE